MQYKIKVTVKKIRNSATVAILWQVNPVSYCKSFGKIDCRLCMRERLEILKAPKEDPKRLINSCNDFYVACMHIPKFYRYTNYITSTYEG